MTPRPGEAAGPTLRKSELVRHVRVADGEAKPPEGPEPGAPSPPTTLKRCHVTRPLCVLPFFQPGRWRMGRPRGAVERFGPSPHPLPGGPSGRPLPPPPLRLARPLDSPGEVAPDAMTASRGVCCQKRVLAARRRLRAMPSRRRGASSRPPRTF